MAAHDAVKLLSRSLVLPTPELLIQDAPEPPMSAEVIPVEAYESKVPVMALYRTLHHGESCHGDSHRFNVSADPDEATSMIRLNTVYQELEEDVHSLPYRVLIEHPLIQDNVMACQTYKLLDVKGILSSTNQDVDTHSVKTLD